MNLPLFSIDSTTLLAIVVVSLLMVVLLVVRNYHKRLHTRQVVLEQTTISKEESPILEN